MNSSPLATLHSLFAMILFNLQEKMIVISICHEHEIKETLSPKIDIKNTTFQGYHY